MKYPPDNDLREEVFVPPGHYRLIRVDGTAVTVTGRQTPDPVMAVIRCFLPDSVTLTCHPETGLPEIVMLVDDEAALDPPKPVNEKASRFYRAVTFPFNPWLIRGHVVLVNDADSA